MRKGRHQGGRHPHGSVVGSQGRRRL